MVHFNKGVAEITADISGESVRVTGIDESTNVTVEGTCGFCKGDIVIIVRCVPKPIGPTRRCILGIMKFFGFKLIGSLSEEETTTMVANFNRVHARYHVVAYEFNQVVSTSTKVIKLKQKLPFAYHTHCTSIIMLVKLNKFRLLELRQDDDDCIYTHWSGTRAFAIKE